MKVNETARYLASYLQQHQHVFMYYEDWDSRGTIDLDKLQELIQEFYDTLK